MFSDLPFRLSKIEQLSQTTLCLCPNSLRRGKKKDLGLFLVANNCQNQQSASVKPQ